MSFIGIISDLENEDIIKKILNNKLNEEQNKYDVILINEKSIENLKNIKFETILITNNTSIMKNNIETLTKMILNAKYLIINADIDIELNNIDNVNLNVISFGFNSKSTITASSVEDEILVCVQRNIIDINKKIIEPQEIKIRFLTNNIGLNTNNLIGISAIMLLYGKMNKKKEKN